MADVLDKRLRLDTPVNIHLTGCPNSCAQHYMGDIGMIGTKVEAGDDMVEGYHVFVGGGYGADQAIGRELYRNVVGTELPVTIEKMLRGYMAERATPQETFNEFVRRHETEQLLETFERQASAAAGPVAEPDPFPADQKREPADGCFAHAESCPG